MDTLFQDLRHAARSLRRSPGFTLVAVLTLALGIGANTAIFSVVNSVLLRPLPYEDPERLVSLGRLMHGEYLFAQDESRSFTEVALYQPSVGFNLSEEGDPERLTGAYASTNLFSTLGALPLLGRGFAPDEDRPDRARVVVLSHGLWRQRFGADPGIVGRQIRVNSEPHTVVGVMPAGFHFPAAGTRLWVPFSLDRGDPAAMWGGGGGWSVARLRPGVTAARAQAELRALAPRLREANTLWTFVEDYRADWQVVPLRAQVVGDAGASLMMVLGAVSLVLLIACANVANLLLARATARRREVAVRAALGASRGRLLGQFLTESTLLALLGGGLGLLSAFWGVRLLVSGLPADTPRLAEIGMDGRVLGFTLGVSVLTGLVFGLVPALRASRPDPQDTLRAAGRGAAGDVRQRRLSGGLVAAEVALATVLVIGAGLLIRSFRELLRVDPGFRAESVVTARVTPPEARYDEPGDLRAFYRDLIERVEALPGVRSANAVDQLPLVGDFAGFAFETEDDPYLPGTAAPTTSDRRVTPDYIRAMGIPLLRGRGLRPTDREGAPRVALVNETMAREFWPGQDPVGKRFRPVWWRDEWITVVGVVGDVRFYGLASETEPEIYRPFMQEPTSAMTLVVRAASDAGTLAASLRAAVAAVDPDVPVSEVRTTEELVSASVAEPRFTMLLLAAFAAVALLLGAIGIYGVVAYAVTQRTREIGVRMALGARREDVLRMVVGQGAGLAAAGVALGMLAALAGTRALRGMLFGVGPLDPITFAAVPLLLAGVALLASWLPARRAARVDPVEALRAE